MRTLPTAAQTEADRATGSYPIRVLQIDLPSSNTIYLSDRTVTPESGVETLPVVKSWGDLRLDPQIGQVGGYGSFTCTVSDLDWLLFDAEATQPGIQFVKCTLYLWFNGTLWSEKVPLFTGTMAPQDFQVKQLEVNLTIRGFEEFLDKDLGFNITQLDFPTIKCSECDGTIIPLVFGRPAYRIPVCPIVQPARSILALPLSICDSMLQIPEDCDLLGFPVGPTNSEPDREMIQLVVGVNGDYDILDGYFDAVTKTIFHITDRLSYHAHAETSGVWIEGGLTWVTIDKDDIDDAGAQDMRGYPIIFPQRFPSGQAHCLMSVVQFWDEPDGIDPNEIAVWPDNRNEFPTSDVDGEEYIILNRLSVPFYPAGTQVVQVGNWVWAANFLPSEAIDRVEVKGTLEDGTVVFYTINSAIYDVDLNNQDYNTYIGRDPSDPGLTTITMDTSPIENGFRDDIMYVTIRGVKHDETLFDPPHNPLASSLVDGEAIENPAAVIAEIISNPFLGNVTDFQLDVLQDAFDEALIVFAFGILESRGMWEIVGDLAKQSGLLVFVDGGEVVVRRVLRELSNPTWTSNNLNRLKASLTCEPRDMKEMPVQLTGKYRPSGGDEEQKIIRKTSDLASVARQKKEEMDFWAIQAPSNVAYMTEWWLLQELTRNRRFKFQMFMEYLAAQPGDMLALVHDVVNDVPEDETHIDTIGRLVSITHKPGNANSQQMELFEITIECHEWVYDLYLGEEPYECGVMRTTVEEPPPTVYTQEAAGQVPGGSPASYPTQQITPENVTTIIGTGSGLLFGKTDEQLLKGNTRTVSQYTDDATDTGTNHEVKNHFEDIDTGRWVWYAEITDGVYYIVRAET